MSNLGLKTIGALLTKVLTHCLLCRAASIPEKAVKCERTNDLSNAAGNLVKTQLSLCSTFALNENITLLRFVAFTFNVRAKAVKALSLLANIGCSPFLFFSSALAPKTASPNQMWKPLAPAALLGKPNSSEAPKSNPSKVIQIEAQPLHPVRVRSKATPAAAPVAPDLACMDHDYCLSNKSVSPGESGKRWNIKQQSVFTIKPLRQHPSSPPPTLPPVLAASPQEVTNFVISPRTQDCPQTFQTQKNRDASEQCSIMETSDFSPSQQERVTSPRMRPSGRSYRRYVASRTPSPSSSPKERTRGWSKKRFYRSPSPTSSCSDAYTSRSRSTSKSPAKKRFVFWFVDPSLFLTSSFNFSYTISYFLFCRYRHRNSDSSLSSSSRSSSRSSPSLSRSPPRRRRYSYSSSRSGSWSRSTSRSPSPQRQAQWSRSRGLHRYLSLAFLSTNHYFCRHVTFSMLQ